MKIKVGDKVYTSADGPIMVILTPEDKKNIAQMLPECTKYAEFDKTLTEVQIKEWMAKV